MANSYGARWFDMNWLAQFDSDTWAYTINDYPNRSDHWQHTCDTELYANHSADCRRHEIEPLHLPRPYRRRIDLTPLQRDQCPRICRHLGSYDHRVGNGFYGIGRASPTGGTLSDQFLVRGDRCRGRGRRSSSSRIRVQCPVQLRQHLCAMAHGYFYSRGNGAGSGTYRSGHWLHDPRH